MEQVVTGWALKKDGKYWGLLCQDGHSTSYGWTDNIDNIKISRGQQKPPTKAWFTHSGSHYIDEMNKGAWVFIKVTKSVLEM